jgi:hypothetical protein
MQELSWSEEQMQMATAAVVERFALNSVARQFVPETTVEATATSVPWGRFDFGQQMVVDGETLTLFEPYATVRLTRAQADEASLHSAMTTLHRRASALARWHDALVFVGPDVDVTPPPPGVVMPPPRNNSAPISLREAAIQAEAEEGTEPIPVEAATANEALVAAFFAAVLRLEERGYYRDYHMALGQRLWAELNNPNEGALVLPRERMESTLMGGGFYRTTTIPPDEALLVSLDGHTFDCVLAGDPAKQPSLEFLRAQADERGEEIYQFRIRERQAPRVRENRAIVRLRLTS